MGALRCVGFDISDAFIEQARRFAAGNFDCEFVQSDVYAIPATYDAQFDLVLITIGALSWMPDLQPFFAVIARLLKPDGHLFMYEEHPMLYMFETSETDDPPRIRNSYFRTEPFVDTSGIDYIGNTTYESSPQYNFHHKMSDIIEGCLQNGLTLISFREYEHDISTIFAHFEKFKYKPAMCYTLVAKRTDA
jgi:ubiquinone/menaquinone biosynthesis C-methylase UbiE